MIDDPSSQGAFAATIEGQTVLPGVDPAEKKAITDDDLGALIEALLLVATEPPTVSELAEVAEVAPERIESVLTRFPSDTSRGWFVQRHGDLAQLATAPRFASYIRTFLGLDREARLSAAALETLAIVAYQQPVTRGEIEAFRGVDTSGVLATLHARGLIEGISRLATIGTPIQYGTTSDFLKHFGISSLADMPPLGDIGGEDGGALLESLASANLAANGVDGEPVPPS